MTNLVYATSTDLETAADEVTRDKLNNLETVTIDRLLESASRAVRRYTRAARYEVDETFMPTDTRIRDAMRKATVIQTLTVIECDAVSDVLTGGVGAVGEVTSTSENGASLTFDNSAHAAALAQLRDGELTPEAQWVLKDAGLTGLPMIGFGGGGW